MSSNITENGDSTRRRRREEDTLTTATTNIAEPEPTVSITKPKQPPPENPADIHRRSLVILSFWAIVIFLGLPIWWKTTSIYRANLPLSEMMSWADGKVYSTIIFHVASY